VAIYLGILIAAAIEGEVAFVAAATLVSRGYLHPAGVVAAGTVGAALGDQFYFYLLRGRLHRWLDRFPAIARRREALTVLVRRHGTLTILAIRFAPGLRIALAAACAYADLPPWKLTLLNFIASFLWATGLLAIVAYVGPAFLQRHGISGWWSALVPALVVLIVFAWLRRLGQHKLEDPPGP
jgi:membrane protein DedA with SNARE-associated domain